MNASEALCYLRQAASRGYKLGLERVSELTARLGMPQNAYQTIHISGTNGKGSVGAMLAAVLRKAGYVTGHFASPALRSPFDYFQIGGIPVPPDVFAQAISEVHACAEQMDDLPTEFEILAAAAFTVFRQQHCQIAVIECCMGGDSDCTNVIAHPLLSVITNVRLDHCAFLGSSLPEIAAHKAGIIKQDCPVLTGCSDPDVVQVIRAYAEKMHSALYFPDTPPEIIRMSPEGTDCFSPAFDKLHLGLPGTYQPENAAIVLRAVSLLRDQGLQISDDAVRNGLADCRWRGRMELLAKQPVVMFDGAHNPDGMQAAVSALTQFFGENRSLSFVIGVMADKAFEQYPALLAPLANQIFTVTPDNPRALSAAQLADVFRAAGIPAVPCDSVLQAVSGACDSGHPVIGLGSLYLYDAFCDALTKKGILP
ncbi:MAG TPA: bifunctional folylpolyglutamate synthase/dihydrofolate synthase [Ruminococcus sp.]|nr:bifunctional folylpolyglutamate synthase/dihydrofolate synthase [Ruminococcus sp.]